MQKTYNSNCVEYQKQSARPSAIAFAVDVEPIRLFKKSWDVNESDCLYKHYKKAVYLLLYKGPVNS